MIAGIFLDTFLVIVLGGLATALAGGTIVLRRIIQLTTAKTETQLIKTRAERDREAHMAGIQRIGQERALLQLTAGEQAAGQEIKTQQQRSLEDDEEVEVVNPGKNDVHFPHPHPAREYRASTAVRPEDIEDAEFD